MPVSHHLSNGLLSYQTFGAIDLHFGSFFNLILKNKQTEMSKQWDKAFTKKEIG